MAICYDGVIFFAQRYSSLAQELLQQEEDPTRIAELEQIGKICQRVPKGSPTSFHEAIQSVWIVFLALQSTMNYVPLGRLDQYLYPFLRSDLESERISLEQAQELVDCLWIKLNERTSMDRESVAHSKVDPHFMQLGGHFDIELEPRILANHFQENIVLAGLTPAGEDGTNELTRLCLNAVKRTKLINPPVYVRFHKRSPSWLLKKSCEPLQDGGGIPVIYNDDVIVRGFEKIGIPSVEANDYTNDGCSELMISGRTEYRYSHVDFLKCLEYVLNNGKDRITGEKEGIETGDPCGFKCYQDVLDAFKSQLGFTIEELVREILNYYGKASEIAPVPFLSSLLDGCLEKGLDLTEGGTRYTFHAALATGVSDTIDSLAAIKKIVFEQKMLTMEKLVKLLDSNFQGAEDMRQLLVNKPPKYGNDDDYADDIAKELLVSFTTKLKRFSKVTVQTYSGRKEIRFLPGIGTFERYILLGKRTGASPNGRFAKGWISSNFTPVLGADRKGPTCTVKSFTKMDFTELPAGAPLDLRLNKRAVGGKEGLARLMAFVKSFLDLGGNMLSINVNDTATLRKAQKDPEKYRDLVVKVGGFQAYFVLMAREHQEHHIARTEHGLA